MDQAIADGKKELAALCDIVRTLVGQNEYDESERRIVQAMEKYPHAPEPHNLIGVLLENKGDHAAAMKHFRAAWALDPTYMPARYNVDRFISFFTLGKCAFDESDCPQYEAADNLEDRRRVGHAVRRD